MEIHRQRVDHAATSWVIDDYNTRRGCRCWRRTLRNSRSWSYGGSRCWCRARRTYWNQGPSATRRTTNGIAEVLIKTAVISLRACGCVEVAVKHLTVNDIE